MALTVGLGNAAVDAQVGAPPADFGLPPAGEYQILFNDHHVYSKPILLRGNRILAGAARGGTLLIPLRSMFEQMGAEVSYDPASKTITVSKPGAEVRLTVGDSHVVVNDKSLLLDVPPIIEAGIVLVPVRIIAESLGAYVQWVPKRNIVVVRYLPPSPPPPPPPPPAPPPPPPTSQPSAAPIARSIAAMYNSGSPERCATCPQFGRYSYVIVADKGARAAALLDAIINGGSGAGAALIQSAISKLGNSQEYKSVNVFLAPALASVNVASISTPAQALNAYDVNAAGLLRQRYCIRRSNTICNKPFDIGPVLLIFLQPVSEFAGGVKLPNALAVDLTRVPSAQFPHVVDVVEQVMGAPSGYAWGDRILPLSATDTVVASFMNNLQNELAQIPGTTAILDLSHFAP